MHNKPSQPMPKVGAVGFSGANFQFAKITKTRVIRKNSKEEVKGKDTLVKPGDTVFVPKLTEFGPREIASLIGTTASIIIAGKAVGVF